MYMPAIKPSKHYPSDIPNNVEPKPKLDSDLEFVTKPAQLKKFGLRQLELEPAFRVK